MVKTLLELAFSPLFASSFNDWIFIFIAQILTGGVGQIWVYPKRNIIRTYTDICGYRLDEITTNAASLCWEKHCSFAVGFPENPRKFVLPESAHTR